MCQIAENSWYCQRMQAISLRAMKAKLSGVLQKSVSENYPKFWAKTLLSEPLFWQSCMQTPCNFNEKETLG